MRMKGVRPRDGTARGEGFGEFVINFVSSLELALTLYVDGSQKWLEIYSGGQ